MVRIFILVCAACAAPTSYCLSFTRLASPHAENDFAMLDEDARDGLENVLVHDVDGPETLKLIASRGMAKLPIVASHSTKSFHHYLLGHATSFQGQPTTVLTFGNGRYAEIIVNFMASMRLAAVDNYAIICTDEELFYVMREIGRPCYLRTHEFGKHALWRLRLNVLAEALHLGIGVVMSDADAIWLRDPFPVIGDIDADVVASIGLGPKAARTAWGAAACMGFMYFRANAAAEHIVTDSLAVFDEYNNDQSAMNAAMLQNGVVFSEELPSPLLSLSDQSKSSGSNATLAFLDEVRFPRQDCSDLRLAMVAHCRTIPGGHAKVRGAMSEGLWVLKTNWSQAHYRGGFAPWLGRITAAPPGFGGTGNVMEVS